MKAAVLVQQGSPLMIADVQVPAIGAGQVLVKIAASGLCGTQLNEISGLRGDDPYLPHLLGHEGGGVVVDIGAGVRKVKPGDRVVLHWMKGSGIDAAAPTFRLNGSVVNAGCVTTLNEYAVASENRLTKIPPDLSAEVACLLGCTVTSGLGIIFHEALVRPGQSVLVFGVGGVGLNVVQGARLVNAYPIVAVDLTAEKLVRAKAFGATHTIEANCSGVASALTELTRGVGFDIVVDTTGNSDAVQIAYAATSRTGTTVLAGMHHHQQPITIDAFPLILGRKLIGSYGGGTRPDIDIPRALQLYQLGKLKLDEQITHRYRLDQVNEAVDAVRAGRVGKCVITVSE